MRNGRTHHYEDQEQGTEARDTMCLKPQDLIFFYCTKLLTIIFNKIGYMYFQHYYQQHLDTS